MPLTVRRTDAERIAFSYSNGFTVDLPQWAGRDADQLVASDLKHRLKQRVRRDAKETAVDNGKRFSLILRTIRVADFASGLGSCVPEGNTLINWHLIFAPTKVLKYVVVHEPAHLRHRSHGQAFWQFVGSAIPDYLFAKAGLIKTNLCFRISFSNRFEE